MKIFNKKLILLALTAIFVMVGVLSGSRIIMANNLTPEEEAAWWPSSGSNKPAAANTQSPFPTTMNFTEILEGTNPSNYVEAPQNYVEAAAGNDMTSFRTISSGDLENLTLLNPDGTPILPVTPTANAPESDWIDWFGSKILALPNYVGPKQFVSDANGSAVDKMLAASKDPSNYRDPSKAGLEDKDPTIFEILANIFAWLLYLVAWALGWIVSKEIDVLLTIMSYPINLSIDAVSNGWAIVRDVCNNFFIVILLAIAVGTILRVPSYKYKEALPKLLIAAVLINFSKMIAGVFIDVSQILMLSFAAPLVTIKGNNIILAALGLPDLFVFMSKQAFTERNSLGVGNVIVVMIWALVVSFVAFIVIACIIIILIYRIVILLFLAILSPIPFFAGSFEKLKKYGGEWWDNFTKYLIVGPAMLFFLWIAFSIMGFNSQTAQQEKAGQMSAATIGGAQATTEASNRIGSSQQQILSEAMTTTGMINFSFVIVLLVMSLVMGQRFGGAGAGAAKTGMGFLNKQAKKITSLPGAAGRWGAGRVVGSKPVGGIAQLMARSPLRFLGAGRLANVVGKQRVSVLGAKAKYEQDRISTISRAGRYSDKSEGQLQKLANSSDRYTRLAAIQTLSKKGLLRDDDKLNSAQKEQRVGLINRFRSDLSDNPEFLQQFDDETRKYSPNLAMQSSMYNKNGKVDVEKLTSDMVTGKMDISKLMGSLDSNGLKLLNDSLVAAGKGGPDNAIAKLIMEQTKGDQKEMEKIYGGMDDNIKKEVGKDVKADTFKDDVSGKINEDLREAYIKASKNFNFKNLFDPADKEKKDNFISENGAFIASNIDAKTTAAEMKDIIDEIGHALDPKHIETLTGRSKDLKKKVQDAFKDLADGVSGTDISAANTNLATKKAATVAARAAGVPADIAIAEKEEADAKAAVDRNKNIFQNSLLSGAEFDVGTDADRQNVLKEVMKGKKKKEVLEKMNSKNINQNFIDATYDELSGKDYETIADRSKEDKAALKLAFTDSINGEPDPDKAAKRIKKSLQADVFDSSIASTGGAAFDTALNGITTDQLSNMDDNLHTSLPVITNLISESDPNALVDWLSSRTAKNINLRKAVLNAIKSAGPGGTPNNLYNRVDKKNLI